MARTPIASATSGILGSFFNGLLGMGCTACSLVTTMIRPDPPGGAAFDAFPADDQRQQSGVAEDLGHSPAFPVFAEEVSFELVGIDDARRSDVGHGPQAAQVRGSSGVNSLLIAVPFRMRRHIRQRPASHGGFHGMPASRTDVPLREKDPKGRGHPSDRSGDGARLAGLDADGHAGADQEGRNHGEQHGECAAEIAAHFTSQGQIEKHGKTGGWCNEGGMPR